MQVIHSTLLSRAALKADWRDNITNYFIDQIIALKNYQTKILYYMVEYYVGTYLLI